MESNGGGVGGVDHLRCDLVFVIVLSVTGKFYSTELRNMNYFLRFMCLQML